MALPLWQQWIEVFRRTAFSEKLFAVYILSGHGIKDPESAMGDIDEGGSRRGPDHDRADLSSLQVCVIAVYMPH